MASQHHDDLTAANPPPLSRSQRRRIARRAAKKLAQADALLAGAQGTYDKTQAEARRAPGADAGTVQAVRAGRASAGLPARRGSRSAAAESSGQAQDTLVAELEGMAGLFGGRPRQTLPVNANVLGRLPWAFLPRRQYQSLDLTTLTDGEFNAQQMLDLLVDAWPEMGLALWNIVRLCMTGWTYEVRTPGNLDVDPTGKSILDALISRINADWGGFEALLTQWTISVAIQGACAGETVPNAELDGVDDLITVQPWTIYFQRDVDQKYIAFQWQPMLAASGLPAGGLYGEQPGSDATIQNKPGLNSSLPAPDVAELLMMRALSHGGFRQLNEVTFSYVPLDADIDDPYGRMPLAPVLQLVQFDAQLLKDLRQWSHNNAWGRMDVSVVAEKVLSMAPATVIADPKKKRAWLSQYLKDIISNYNQLNPDDTFVHWDNVAVAGVDATGETFDIDKLMRLIERRVFRALKQLPILMGSNEGTTETWGTLQMEVYAQGIRSMQKVVASLVNKLLGVALRLYGHNGVVEFTFNELRSSARMQDAQAAAIEIRNAAAKRDQGWISQDDAAIEITGSEAIHDAPDPDPEVAPAQPDAGTEAPPPAPVIADAAEDPPDATDSADASSTSDDKGEGKSDGKGDDEPPPSGGGSRAAVTRRAVNDPPAPHTGVMASFFLPDDAAQALADALPAAFSSGEHAEPRADYHLTLTFHGDTVKDALSDEDVALVRDAIERYAESAAPLDGVISGVGRFTPEGADSHPLYASVDIPGLRDWRDGLLAALDAAGLPERIQPRTTYEYQPHITLGYIPADSPTPVDTLPAIALHFAAVTLAAGGVRQSFALTAASSNDDGDDDAGEHALRAEAMTRALAWAATRDGSDGSDGSDAGAGESNALLEPSAARVAVAAALKRGLSVYFMSLHIDDKTLQQAVDLVTNATLDGDLAEGQREALITTIEQMLREAVPDADGELNDLLHAARVRAWNEAGQEALGLAQLDGTFKLTNKDILAQVERTVNDRVPQLQGVTRQRLSAVIVESAENLPLETSAREDLETVADAVDAELENMADTRARVIADTETADAWGDADMETWSRNGVTSKAWRTGDNPDPSSKRFAPCRDNAYASPVAIWDTFPSGDLAPPAHPSCRCVLLPASDPSSIALEDPWSGA